MDGIKEAKVQVARKNEPTQQIVAFNILDGNLTNKSKIISNLNQRLPSFMVPKVCILDEFPKLVNGKVDRQQLIRNYVESTEDVNIEITDKELADQGLDIQHWDVARTVLKTIRNIVKASKEDHVRLDDNFFEIGGNSINSTMAVSMMKDQGLDIDVEDFVKAKSLRELILNRKSDHGSSLKFKLRTLKPEDKEVVANMIAQTYITQVSKQTTNYPNQLQTYVDNFPIGNLDNCNGESNL